MVGSFDGVVDGTALGFSVGAVFVSAGPAVAAVESVLTGSVGAAGCGAGAHAASRMDRSIRAGRRVLMGFPPWGMWMR